MKQSETSSQETRATGLYSQEVNNSAYAFPNQHRCLDFLHFLKDHLSNDALDELEALLDGTNDLIEITLKEEWRVLFQHLYFEQGNAKKRKAEQLLYLGFPILQTWVEGRLQSIPIFFLALDLRPKINFKDAWEILLPPDSTPFLNPRLDFGQNQEELEKSLKAHPFQSQFLQKAIAALEIEWPHDSTWHSYPQSKDWVDQDTQQLLLKSALLGLFQPFENKQDTSPQVVFKNTESQFTWKHHFGLLDLDPSQRRGINHLYTQKDTTIIGKAGSGKVHLIQFLISNALSNGKKVLYLGTRKEIIQEVQSFLVQYQLSYLSFWIPDQEDNAPTLKAILNARIQSPTQVSNFQGTEFQKELNELQQKKEKADQITRSVRRPVFGPFDWSQTVGLYLKSQARAGKELLNTQFIASHFSYTPSEFTELSQAMGQAQPLFEAVGTIRHPLRRLHPQIFSSLSQEESFEFIQSKLNFFLQQFSGLQQAFINCINQYAQRLEEYFHKNYYSNQETIQQLLQQIDNNTNAYGSDFLLSSDTSVSLLSPFSSKVKKIKAEREKVQQDFERFLRQFQPLVEFEFEVKEGEQIKSIRGIQSFLQQTQEKLAEWFEETPLLREQALKRLSYQSALSSLKMQGSILDLEARLDQTLQELNQSQLLDEDQNIALLNFPQRQKRIEALIDQLENLRLNLRDFKPFYQWQAFWLNQTKERQELIKAIIRVKPHNWVAAFEDWYLGKLLSAKHVATLPESSFGDYSFVERQTAFLQQLPQQIAHLWSKTQEQSNKGLKRLLRPFDQSNTEVKLAQLFNSLGDQLTDYFPLILGSPTAVERSISIGDTPRFDLVIFDAAQFIDQNLGMRLRNLGNQALIIGDASYITDDDVPDLLEYHLKQEADPPALQFIHQYYPGHIGQLLQASSISVKNMFNYSIAVHPVGGHYEEQTRRNLTEQQKVLDLLFNIPANAQRTFPRIALVSSTAEQRDGIASQVLSIIQEPGESSIKSRLIQMEHSGLQILALDELQADRFDVLIFAATYSNTSNREISPHAAYWNTKAGQRQLNELMAVGSQQIHLVHSFSDVTIDQVAQQEEANGYFLFFNYLSLMSALQNDNEAQYDITTKRIHQVMEAPAEANISTPFYDELSNRLASYLPEMQINRNEQVAQIILPLCIRQAGPLGTTIAIIADDLLAQGSDTDLRWEMEKRQELRDLGYKILPSWTASWWKSPNKSVKLLSQQILALWEETS